MKSECPFVVGEVYKTRDDQDAEFVIYAPRNCVGQQSVFLINGETTLRFADGQSVRGIERPCDILPERWVVVWRDRGNASRSSGEFYASEAEAREQESRAISYHPIQVPE